MRLAQTIATALLLVGTLSMSASADVIMFEDFEDATINYTPSSADSFGDLATRDFYGRVTSGFGPGGNPFDVSGIPSGTMFYAAEDIDSATGGGGPIANGTALELDFSINITDYDNLVFDIHVAEDDDDATGNEDWDASDEFIVTYQIDGGGFNRLFAVQAEFLGDDFNERPLEDTDFDGVGDGTEITDVFQQFTKNIVGTGSTLDLKITYTSTSYSGDEDIAFDNVTISGDFVGIPEPTTAILLFGLAPLALLRRQR